MSRETELRMMLDPAAAKERDMFFDLYGGMVGSRNLDPLAIGYFQKQDKEQTTANSDSPQTDPS